MAIFVASNLFGPEVHSFYRWRNRDRITLEGGINHVDMSKIALIYSESIAKQLKNKGSLVPVLAAEDERLFSYQQNYAQSLKGQVIGVLWCQKTKPSVP